VFEDVMRPDPTPDDVNFSWGDRRAVLKGGAAIVRPRHFEDASGAFHALHPKTLAKSSTPPQVFNKLLHGSQKCSLLGG